MKSRVCVFFPHQIIAPINAAITMTKLIPQPRRMRFVLFIIVIDLLSLHSFCVEISSDGYQYRLLVPNPLYCNDTGESKTPKKNPVLLERR